MGNPIQQAQELGQAIWSDYIRRGMLRCGEFQGLVDSGVSGVTSNPTIFERAIVGSSDYDSALIELGRQGKAPQEIYETLAVEDVRTAADMLRSVYDATGGADGFVSFEVSPLLSDDTEGTIEEALRLAAAVDRRNVMIKVPATPAGIPAVRRLIAAGINVNVTLIFSRHVYREVAEAYIGGLEDLVAAGGNPDSVASVASFFLSRIDTAVDAILDEETRQGASGLAGLLGKAAVASARLAYHDFKEIFGDERFAVLWAKGARVQRPLWASTGTKNPAYTDVAYVEPLIGANTVNTMPPATMQAFLDHGVAADTLEKDVAEAGKVMTALEASDVSVEAVTDRLLTEGVAAFADSYQKLLAGIERKTVELLSPEHGHQGVSIGDYLAEVEATLARLDADNVVPRIWRKDHTVWKPEPKEITNRLGWLTVAGDVADQAAEIVTFARGVRDAGMRFVVLAGMGGSSLGPEVLHRTFGSREGYPALVVLEAGACVVPAHALQINDSIEPLDTLFLISSKSGGTIEPLSLLDYFYEMVTSLAGNKQGAANFVAITDPGSSLVATAQRAGFSRVFLNQPDIGGRYSVLSGFGIIPAALMGIDIATLLERAQRMAEACASCVPVHENPGAWLGACLATMAQRGRDKLTLVTSPVLDSFGLWVEQLLAESTGKDGLGIVPVVGEPAMAPEFYGDDRFFVYLRLNGDDNRNSDAAVERLEAAGQPVLRLELADRYDLGGEFFRWEFATAVAGAVFGINPFDQPNVQQAKDATNRVLDGYVESGELPAAETTGSLDDLLTVAKPGDYLAIMAYVCESPELDEAFAGLRQRVIERHRIATTLGYGPRFLHSTGQLHKGGPDSGLFLQISAGHDADLSVPGKPYGLSTVADAQILGDLRALQDLGRRVVRLHLDQPDGPDVVDFVRGLLS